MIDLFTSALSDRQNAFPILCEVFNSIEEVTLSIVRELKSQFFKTDTPEIHEPLDLLDFWQKCIMTRNACLRNFSFLAHLLSKLHHFKTVPKLSICKKFYRKALLFETNSFQSLANFNIKKNENVCVVAPLMNNMKYCCYNSIKKFTIRDI